jgi:hypothetical protein
VWYAPVAAVRYLGKIGLPIDLAVHYQAPDHVPATHVVAACTVVAAITAAAIAWRQRAPSLLVGWIWFLALVAPTLGFVRAGSWPAIADRFAYLPLVGPIVAVVFGLWAAMTSPAVRKTIVILGTGGVSCWR